MNNSKIIFEIKDFFEEYVEKIKKDKKYTKDEQNEYSIYEDAMKIVEKETQKYLKPGKYVMYLNGKITGGIDLNKKEPDPFTYFLEGPENDFGMKIYENGDFEIGQAFGDDDYFTYTYFKKIENIPKEEREEIINKIKKEFCGFIKG